LIRTSNAIERLYEEFERSIKTQTVLLHRSRRHVISGADRSGPDHHAESQSLTKPHRETQRSDYLPRRMIGYHHAARRWVKRRALFAASRQRRLVGTALGTEDQSLSPMLQNHSERSIGVRHG
jgi:hypothetical protein